MRRAVVRLLLPFCICLMPVLAGVLLYITVPPAAMTFYVQNFAPMDMLILGLGTGLFVCQLLLCWRALQWRTTRFDDRFDRWVTNLGQAAEWFPMLGLLGTVGGILQTFSSFAGTQPTASLIIQKYAPAITATGTGLFMAFLNILPPWLVLVGRDLILTLSGGSAPPGEAK